MVGTGDTEAVVKFLFDDDSFSFETLRAAGFAMYGGSDLGEVLVTANFNAPGQIVVSGTRAGLDDLLGRHRELGWRRATALPVGGGRRSRTRSWLACWRSR